MKSDYWAERPIPLGAAGVPAVKVKGPLAADSPQALRAFAVIVFDPEIPATSHFSIAPCAVVVAGMITGVAEPETVMMNSVGCGPELGYGSLTTNGAAWAGIDASANRNAGISDGFDMMPPLLGLGLKPFRTICLPRIPE